MTQDLTIASLAFQFYDYGWILHCDEIEKENERHKVCMNCDRSAGAIQSEPPIVVFVTNGDSLVVSDSFLFR